MLLLGLIILITLISGYMRRKDRDFSVSIIVSFICILLSIPISMIAALSADPRDIECIPLFSVREIGLINTNNVPIKVSNKIDSPFALVTVQRSSNGMLFFPVTQTTKELRINANYRP